MPTKICTRCGEPKDVSCFSKMAKAKDGLFSYCKPCRSEDHQMHKERDRAVGHANYMAHRQVVIDRSRERKRKNASQISTKEKLRRRTDVDYKIKANLRARLYQAVRRGWRAGSAIRDLGCTVSELRIRLESQFKPGMSWDNYGEWHIDHIKPLAKFDLTDRQQFLEACHYTNLQPLWATENFSKGAR